MSDRLPPAMDAQDLINSTPIDIINNAHSRNMFKLFILVRHNQNGAFRTLSLFELCMKIQKAIAELEELFDQLIRKCSIAQNELLEAACPNNDIWINRDLTVVINDIQMECSNTLISSEEMTEFREFILTDHIDINI